MTPLSADADLADRYLLGLLDPQEQTATAERIARDRGFAALVAAAQRRFMPLDDTAAPIPLSSGAWGRLEARLTAHPVTLSPAPPVPPVPPAPPVLHAARPPADNLNRAPWRTGAGLVAGLLLAVALVWSVWVNSPGDRRAGAIAVAVLLDPDGVPFAVIEDFGGGEAAVTALVAYVVPEGKSLQAWTKWSDETGPMSLGVLDAFTNAPLGADGLPRPVSGQLYEITLEDEGGSDTGRPTGPILGVGRASIPG